MKTGKEVLGAYNDQNNEGYNGFKTLEEHIDDAIHEATSDSLPSIPYKLRYDLEKLLNEYNDKLINHRSGMITLIDQAVSDYEKNVACLKKLLRQA